MSLKSALETAKEILEQASLEEGMHDKNRREDDDDDTPILKESFTVLGVNVVFGRSSTLAVTFKTRSAFFSSSTSSSSSYFSKYFWSFSL